MQSCDNHIQLIEPNTESGPMIGVLYNNSYGGFSVSNKAKQIYNERMSEENPEYKSRTTNGVYDDFYDTSRRHDPLLVNIYHELGQEFNGAKHTKIKIKTIPKKYENAYIIHEYDGLESVSVDNYKYKLDAIQNIIHNIDMNDNDVKINEINKILSEKEYYVR
jgi:hypothetical protein